MSEGSPDLPDEPPLPTWVQQLRRLQEEEAIKWAGRQFDEDGCHDEDACRVCLEGKAVTNACRCAQCCRRLIIEALVEDAKGEPKIRELGSPILGPPDKSGKRELEGYLLNRAGGGGVCVGSVQSFSTFSPRPAFG